MNVRIKHNGTSITNKVIRYDREHKICSGIGMLELEVAYTYGGTFNPWDRIDIYEGSGLSGRYYVSSVSEGQPSSSFVVTCQDNSKRLTDYFIPDSYLIDYPSYTRYWIETFLEEVGVSYKFLTDDQGSLLSNNTALGLTTAYEQILMLLQMSGWYITFTASGKAHIGKLTTDMAHIGGAYSNNTITEIRTNKHDSMLRNRIVVWGKGDPTSARWVFADVSKHTKWNYDRRDKRTVVIANPNIPTVADAFYMANKALTEFTQITVEKHLTLAGAKSIRVGDVVTVRNKLFTGKGLVTTFGTSMSKDGLVTNLILDERCPRLFGFFDFGGYVYVGTYGSGIWRKRINTWSGLVSSEWFDYSSGLMDMSVVDLHINAGVMASVASSGGIYYNLEDFGPWSGIMIPDLQVVYSGQVLDPTTYSGLMGRACIVDRDTNYLRYAVDNASGINLGDFLMETEGPDFSFFFNTPSGLVSPFEAPMFSGLSLSGMRSWVLDANPYDGSITNTYPVVVSGLVLSSGVMASGVAASGLTYNFHVFDIENDGSHDYVEAMTIASGIIPAGVMYGEYSQQQVITGRNGTDIHLSYDSRLVTTLSYSGYPTPEYQDLQSIEVGASFSFGAQPFSVWDTLSYPSGYAYVAFKDQSFTSQRVNVAKIGYNLDGTLNSTVFHKNIASNYSSAGYMITRVDESNYLFFVPRVVTSPPPTKTYIDRILYNIDTDVALTTEIVEIPSFTDLLSSSSLVRKNYLYTAAAESKDGGNGFKVIVRKLNFNTGTWEDRTMYSVTPTGDGSNNGDITYKSPVVKVFPLGESDVAVVVAHTKLVWTQPGNQFYSTLIRGYAHGYYADATRDQIYDWSADYGLGSGASQDGQQVGLGTNPYPGAVNKDHYYLCYIMDIPGPGSQRITDTITNVFEGIHNLGNYSTVYLYRGPENVGIAKKADGTFCVIQTSDLSVLLNIPHPPGYTLYSYAGVDSFNGDLFFNATKGVMPPVLADVEMVSLDRNWNVTRRGPAFNAGLTKIEHIFGNFHYWDASPGHEWVYVAPAAIEGLFPLYLVLQRDGSEFNVVKSGIYRDRLDISNYAPLMTMNKYADSLELYYISSDNTVLQQSNTAISGYNLGISTASSGLLTDLGVLASDFRYADFETVAESGTSREILIVYSGHLGFIPMDEGLTTFSGINLTASSGVGLSGYVTRVETSNFYLPDQYIFVTVSGGDGSWQFFQKNPASGISLVDSPLNVGSGQYVDYSYGFPQARPTIIRMDDKL